MILSAIIVGILCVIVITFTAWGLWKGFCDFKKLGLINKPFPSAEREDIKELRKEICRLQKAQDNGTKFSQEPAEPEGPELDLIL